MERAWISIQTGKRIDQRESSRSVGQTQHSDLLMYWWHSSKQQPGRGQYVHQQHYDTFPILDVTALDADQLKRATQIFDDTCQLPLKPLHELDIDENRKLARPPLLQRSARLARCHPRRRRTTRHSTPETLP